MAVRQRAMAVRQRAMAVRQRVKEGSSSRSIKVCLPLDYQLKPSKKCQSCVASFAFAQLQRQEYSTKTFFVKNKIKFRPQFLHF